MEILVKGIDNVFEPYVIHNVVSINRIMGHVLIQYIDENRNPQSAHYDETCNVQLTAIVM